MLSPTIPPTGGPSADDQASSTALHQRIVETITAHGGWIPFSEFMNLALYAPGLGYYASGRPVFGSGGDFVTAPELGGLFAETLSRWIGGVLPDDARTITEFGAGNGTLAAQLLAAPCLSDVRYRIVELSGALSARQREAVAAVPGALDRTEWLNVLPDRLDGIVLGNEVLDAMPVHLLVGHNGSVLERGVTAIRGELDWSDAPPTAGALAARAAQRIARGDWPDGYLSEVHPRQEAFVASLAERLHSGALVFIDYGFDEATYYHPQRNQGTLRCHHRHRAGDQPLVWPGLQDITAHVNFDALTEVAAEAGLEGGHVPMAQFLLDAGILEVLSQVSPDDAARYLPLSAEANRLLSPAEMGELFRVAVWGR